MKKKLFALSVIAIISLFSISYTVFASNMVNDIRDGVGDAENTVEDAINAISNTVKDDTETMSNSAENTENKTQNSIENVTAGASTTTDNSMNTTSDYSAARTTTTTDTTTSTGMTTNMYMWIIIGITAVGIAVLLWSYFTQNNSNNIYIDSDDK